MDHQIPQENIGKSSIPANLTVVLSRLGKKVGAILIECIQLHQGGCLQAAHLFFKYKKCPDILELLERAKDFENYPHLKTMEGFFREAREINSEVTDSAKKILSGITPFLVVNRVRTGKDANTGKVIQGLMQNYLGIKSSELMTIREDTAVEKAIAKMKPVMTEAPSSPFSRDIEQIARKLCE